MASYQNGIVLFSSYSKLGVLITSFYQAWTRKLESDRYMPFGSGVVQQKFGEF